MADNRISDIIKTSLEGIRDFTDINSVVGQAINTTSGVTIIPVSKITVGFANGGVDFGKEKSYTTGFGCGGGTGVSITPLAFLVVTPDSAVNLIPMTSDSSGVGRIISVVEHAPEIIEKIRSSLT